MTEEIANRIIDIIVKETDIDRAKLNPESTMDDFGVASITQFEVVFAIEEEFDIEMPDEQEDLTLGGLTATVARLVAEKGAA